jgi:hypothetical protein
MRKIIAALQVSVDGFIKGPNGTTFPLPQLTKGRIGKK